MGKSKEEKEALKKAKQAAAAAANAASVDKPEEKPADKPADKPEDKTPPPADKPTEKQVEKPAEKKDVKKVDKQEKKGQPANKKGDTKKPAEKPAETVTEVEAEEVKPGAVATVDNNSQVAKAFDGTVGSLGDALGIKLGKSTRLSQDKMVDLLTLTKSVLAEEADGPRKHQIKVIFDDMFAYVLILAYFQMYKDTGAEHVSFKPEVLPFALRTFENFGVTFDENGIKKLEDGQMQLNFEKAKVDKDAKAEFERAAAVQAKSISVNPNDWKDDAMLKEGLEAILTGTEEVKTNLSRALEAVRTYRKANESDDKKKDSWDKVPANALFTDLVGIIGKLPIVLEGGIMSSVKMLVNSHKNPIMAFLKMKAHMPQFSDKDVAEVTIELVKSKVGAKNFEKTEIYSKMFANNAEYYKGLVERPAPSNDATPQERMIGEGIRVSLDLLTNSYPDLITDKSDPKKNCKLINKLIEIDNYFKSPEAKLALYDEKGYKSPEAPAATA